MRVCILTSVHRWDDPRVFARQAVTLADAGHEVRLVAPGAATGRHRGVEVESVALPKNRALRMTACARALLRHVRDAEVVHVHDPELLAVLARLVLRRRTARPVLVYDAHEDYAAVLREKEWIPRPVRSAASVVLGRLERFATRRVDLVVAATPAIAERFHDRNVVVVQNFPLATEFPTVRDGRESDAGPVRFIHLGEMNPRRGASAIVVAIRSLRRAGAAVVFEQRGPVKPAGLLDGGDAVVLPEVAHGAALEWAARGDVGLVLFARLPNHERSQPNKLFEYLALGLRVVATDFAHWRDLLGDFADRVTFVDPDDPESVASGMRMAAAAPDRDRQEWADRARARFSWVGEGRRLVAAYDGLARRGARSVVGGRRVAPVDSSIGRSRHGAAGSAPDETLDD